MKLLTLLFFISAFFSFSQEEFRLRPWSDCNDYDKQNQIVISEEGRVISFPQYVNSKKLMNLKGLCKKNVIGLNKNLICLVDKRGELIKAETYSNRYYAKIKANMEYIDSLDNWKSDKVDTTELSKKLKSIGLSVKGYSTAAKAILGGDKPNKEYEFLFPQHIDTIFTKNGANFKAPLSIEIKSVWDHAITNCDCDTSIQPKPQSGTGSFCDAIFFLDRFEVAPKYSFELTSPNLNSSLFESQLKRMNDSLKVLKKEIKSSLLSESGIDSLKAFKRDVQAFLDSKQLMDEAEFDNLKDTLLEIWQAHGKDFVTIAKIETFSTRFELAWFWYHRTSTKYPFSKTYFETPLTKESLDSILSRIKSYELLMSGGYYSDGESMEAISKEYASLVIRKNKIEKALKKKVKFKTENAQSKVDLYSKETVLYKGIIYVSEHGTNKRYFMRSHDALEDSKLYPNQRTEYYDFEEVHYLIHNVVDTKKRLLKQAGGAIGSHTPDWVDDVNDMFISLDPALALTLENVPNFRLQKKSMSAISPTSFNKDNTVEKSKILKKMATQRTRLNGLIDTLDIILKTNNSWESNQLTCFGKIETLLNTKSNEENVLARTIEINASPKGYKPPSTVSYDLIQYKTSKGKEVDQTYSFSNSFSHFKRKRIQLYAGFHYSLTSVDRVVIDESITPVQPEIASKPFQFVVGAKVYPFGGCVEDNRFFSWSRYRFHLNAGASIPKPLDNLYLGLGYDLVPGWSINANLQFYRDVEYDIANGSIVSTRNIYRPSFAMGTGVDVTVFVNAFKFFFR